MSHPYSDPRESLGQINFRLYYGEVLRQALQKARDGVLDPQWRNHVAHAGALAGLVPAADPYGVRSSVITAVNEMPPAAWEPGHSPGWREALDTWFNDSRSALAEHRNITLEQHSRLTRLGASMSAVVRIATPSISDAIMRITDTDACNDDTARKSLSTFIMQRDTLTASYMAALAGAGETVDWRSWFSDRIDTWDDTRAQDSARMRLRQSNSYWERIPEYW